MHYMLVNLLHSHYMQHVMYVITYPLHAFEDANAARAISSGAAPKNAAQQAAGAPDMVCCIADP